MFVRAADEDFDYYFSILFSIIWYSIFANNSAKVKYQFLTLSSLLNHFSKFNKTENSLECLLFFFSSSFLIDESVWRTKKKTIKLDGWIDGKVEKSIWTIEHLGIMYLTSTFSKMFFFIFAIVKWWKLSASTFNHLNLKIFENDFRFQLKCSHLK